jgi:hypothetical protein
MSGGEEADVICSRTLQCASEVICSFAQAKACGYIGGCAIYGVVCPPPV